MPLAQPRDLLEAKTDLYTQALSNLEKEQSTLESNANSAASSARSYRQRCSGLHRPAGSRPRRSGTSARLDRDRRRHDPGRGRALRDGLRRQIDRLIGDIQLFQSRANVALGQIDGITARRWRSGGSSGQAPGRADGQEQLQSQDRRDAVQPPARSARDQIDQIKPDGDKKDLEAYVGNAEDDLEPALERFEEAEEEFADRFEGIFVPPYNDLTNERWVQFAEWEDWADDIEGCAAPDQLVNLETSADRHWGARPDQITDPQAREIVEDALEAEAERWSTRSTRRLPKPRASIRQPS